MDTAIRCTSSLYKESYYCMYCKTITNLARYLFSLVISFLLVLGLSNAVSLDKQTHIYIIELCMFCSKSVVSNLGTVHNKDYCATCSVVILYSTAPPLFSCDGFDASIDGNSGV